MKVNGWLKPKKNKKLPTYQLSVISTTIKKKTWSHSGFSISIFTIFGKNRKKYLFNDTFSLKSKHFKK